jgi:hypothetical protein
VVGVAAPGDGREVEAARNNRRLIDDHGFVVRSFPFSLDECRYPGVMHRVSTFAFLPRTDFVENDGDEHAASFAARRLR